MEATKSFDEEEARLLLIGNASELNDGLERIRREYEERMMRWILRRFPGLDAPTAADVWAETLAAIWELVRDGKFDANKPLPPLLCAIGFRKATDRLRRRTTADAVLQAVGKDLTATNSGRTWRALDTPERQELQKLIRAEVAKLPPQQRVVFQAWLDGYPETKRTSVLQEDVSKRTGRPETIASVKRPLEEALRKIREFLQRKGFGPQESR